jgi:hypothetical protein
MVLNGGIDLRPHTLTSIVLTAWTFAGISPVIMLQVLLGLPPRFAFGSDKKKGREP